MRTRIYRMNIYYKRELNSFIKTDFIPQNVPQNRVFCKKNGRFSIQICKKYGIYALFLCINAVFWSRRRDLNPRPSRPERDALPAALRLDFLIFRYFRKWSNMWSSHLFRTFCGKVYRPNCQCCQGVQRFEKVCQGKPLWVSRTLRATSCATPRFFQFFIYFRKWSNHLFRTLKKTIPLEIQHFSLTIISTAHETKIL